MSSNVGTTFEVVPETIPSVPEPERHGNLSSSHRPEPEGDVEPTPEWNTAIATWGYAWDVHRFGIGAIFGVIAILSLATLVRLRMGQQSSSKRMVSIVLHGLLVVYGISRCLFLCIDAYRHKNIMPIALTNILWGIAQPCLITSYSLLFVVLRNAILLRQRFQTWFTTRNIALIVIPHFLFVLVSELAVSFSPKLKVLTFICQIFYALLSFLLSFFYFYVATLIWKSVINIQGLTTSNSNSLTTNPMFRILLACIAVALVGLTITGLQLWIIAGPLGIFSNTANISAWSWYISTTSMRILEVIMAAILFVITRHQSKSTVRSLPKSHKTAWTVQ